MTISTTSDVKCILTHLWRSRRPATPLPFASVANAEFYRRGWPKRIERYEEDGDWITIGGHAEEGKAHAEGTPVKVNKQGDIIGGPEALHGMPLRKLDQNKQGDGAKPDRHGAEFDRREIDRQLNTTGKASHGGASVEIVKHPTGLGYAAKLTHGGREVVLETPPDKAAWRDAHERAVQALQEATTASQTKGQTAATEPPKAPTEAAPPPTVKKSADGNWTGPAMMRIEDLDIDPARFQYKLDVSGEFGVGEELKSVNKFNPDFAGRFLVWHDPKDGKNYVINGHHRYELAHRTGYDDYVSVQFIDAKNETAARARGAMANIAEGRGTAIDAANFLRETKGTIKDFEEHGVSLRGAVARNAVALSSLSDNLFSRLHNGILREGRALAISRNLTDHQRQDKLFRIINKKEEGRKTAYTDAEVAEMAKKMSWAGSRTVQGTDLFGSFEDENDTFVEEAELQSGVRGTLNKMAKHFKNVASTGAQAILEEGGRNRLDADFNAAQADITRRLETLFDQQIRLRGPLTEAFRQSAKELADDPKRKTQIIRDVTARATAILQGIIEGGISETLGRHSEGPECDGSGGEGRQGAPEKLRRAASPNAYREHFQRENNVRRVVERYVRNYYRRWVDLPDRPATIA